MKVRQWPLFMLLGLFSLQGEAKAQMIKDPLASFRPVKLTMPKGACLYEDQGPDVKESSLMAIDRLLAMADANRSECSGITMEVKDVQENVKNYFDSVYKQDGMSRENGESFLELNCRNYDKFLQMSLGQYRQHLLFQGKLDESNPFKGQCLFGEDTRFSRITPQMDQCLKDVLAQELRRVQEACAGSDSGFSKRDLQDWRDQIRAQEIAALNLQKGMSHLFQNALSGKCFNGKEMAKAIVQSVITIGASVSSAALGPAAGVGVALGGMGINFAIEFISQLKDEKLTIREILRDQNFEKASCMFMGLTKRYCDQLEVTRPTTVEFYACSLRDHRERYPVVPLLDRFRQDLKANEDISSTEGNGTASSWPGNIQDFRDLITTMQTKVQLPYRKSELDEVMGDESRLSEPEKKTLEEILMAATDFYQEGNQKKKRNQLLQFQESLNEGKELLSLYEKMSSPSTASFEGRLPGQSQVITDKFQAKRYLEKRMGEIMGQMGALPVGDLMEKYLNGQAFGQEGLDKLLAEEMSMEIVKSFQKKLQHYEGNMDSLRDVIDSAVEQFKPVFQERMERRFHQSFQNAAMAEEALQGQMRRMRRPASRSLEDSSPLQDRRREVFSWLRDIVKDCLSTQSIFFMKREKPGFWSWLFNLAPQPSALLNIDRTPEFYLKACAPFMCQGDAGIPIPSLPSSDTASVDFQQYSCRLQDHHEEIFNRLRDQYVEKGTICGQSIGEITRSGFKAGNQDISSLKRAIRR